MSSVVRERGDVRLKLGATFYHLRPTFSALAAIERDVAPILKLVNNAVEGDVRIEDMATVFHHCFVPDTQAARPTIVDFGTLITKEGLLGPLKSYRALLAGILGAPDGGD